MAPATTHEMAVALLTGAADEPYAYGVATGLISRGVALDLVANDELDRPEFRGNPGVNFLNLRGDQDPDASFARKVFRVLLYYAKLVRYVTTARPRIFHILWNNKFEWFDRTLLMAYYRFLGKRIVFTAHNVNIARRDAKDTRLNRLTLRIQYRLTDHIFVHTERMKVELVQEFGVPKARVTVIPFGINNAVPNTCLTPDEAKQRLRISDGERTILFFGNIAPYKGVEDLIAAFKQILGGRNDYRLIIAGKPKDSERYWAAIQEGIRQEVAIGRVLLRAEYIPDAETELYFKAADVLVLPYRHIYQSGVLFLGHSFGLPVLAADVGSLKDEIVEGKTGFVFRPADPVDLAKSIDRYFTSDLYTELKSRRQEIKQYASERHSWDVVTQATIGIYAMLLRMRSPEELPKRATSSASS
jgi:D-inositol-3-phosphate glycosyltransferase